MIRFTLLFTLLCHHALGDQFFSMQAQVLLQDCNAQWTGSLRVEKYVEIESGWRKPANDWDGVTIPADNILSEMTLTFADDDLHSLRQIEASDHSYQEREICFLDNGQPTISVIRENFVAYRICTEGGEIIEPEEGAQVWIEKLTETRENGFQTSHMHLFSGAVEYPVAQYCGAIQPLAHFWETDPYAQPAYVLVSETLAEIRAAPDL